MVDKARVDGPLAGVRVLDLTHVWAGPLAVRFFADLGADVVRVEAPLGRGTQVYPSEPIGGWLGGEPGDEPWNDNAMFVKLMRNRRSLCVDLKTEEGRELLLRLVAQADMLVENFSARAMASLGLGDEVLFAANPDLIYLSMPGFGHDGPLRDRVAFGPTVEAMSGFTQMMGYAPDEPRNTAMALMDPVCGLNAVAAATEALVRRREAASGNGGGKRGGKVEMSLHEGGVAYNGPWLLDAQMGRAPACQGNRHPQMAPHGVYRCADESGAERWLALACVNDAQWFALCDIADFEASGLHRGWSLAERQAHHDDIDDALAAWMCSRDCQTTVVRLQEAGVAAGPVNAAPQMIDDAQTRAREFFVRYERHDVPMPGNPVRMPGLCTAQWRECPALGADNANVLADWLNMPADEAESLAVSGVLHNRPPT